MTINVKASNKGQILGFATAIYLMLIFHILQPLVALSQSDSVMQYTEEGTDWWTYNNNSFVPIFTDNVDNWEWSSDSLRDSTYDVCGDDSACLYDIYVTGDIAVGASGRATAVATSETNAILGKQLQVCRNNVHNRKLLSETIRRFCKKD